MYKFRGNRGGDFGVLLSQRLHHARSSPGVFFARGQSLCRSCVDGFRVSLLPPDDFSFATKSQALFRSVSAMLSWPLPVIPGSCFQPPAVGRKNWLFGGSREAGQRAAVIYTIISSAKRHDLDIWTYLRRVLERLARGEKDLDALLPDRWKASHPEAVRTYRQHERESEAAATRARRQRRRELESVSGGES
jgi:hypothetical protein